MTLLRLTIFKTADTSDLVKKVTQKIFNHNHIATQELNKLSWYKIKRSKFIKQKWYCWLRKKYLLPWWKRQFNEKVTLNRTKHVLVQNRLNKLS